MCKSNKGRGLVIDEVELEAQLVRNKIADVIQGEFAREINGLVYEEARRCCEGCQLDDPSQFHHECMMTDEDELWIKHYRSAKEHLNVEKLWSIIEKEVFLKLDIYLEDLRFKYLFEVLKVVKTAAFLLYKDFEQRQIDDEDECFNLDAMIACIHCVLQMMYKTRDE